MFLYAGSNVFNTIRYQVQRNQGFRTPNDQLTVFPLLNFWAYFSAFDISIGKLLYTGFFSLLHHLHHLYEEYRPQHFYRICQI